MRYIKKYNDYFLFEAISVKQIKEKYKDIPNKDFSELIKCDPYTKFQKNPETNKYNLTNLGKYGISMLEIYNNLKSSQEKERLIKEDLPKAKQYIDLLYKYRNAIKVNYTEIDSMDKLFNIIKKFLLSADNVDIKILLDNLDKDIDYFLLLNGEKWYIFNPITEKGASILGAGTEWCTSYGKYSTNAEFKERDNYFKKYSIDGPLYILINKEDNSDKYQFHFESNQYKNKYDTEISKEIFVEKNVEIKKYFFPSLFGLKGGIETQFNRLDLLNKSNLKTLVNNLYNYDNELASAILSKDEDAVIKCYEEEYDDSLKEIKKNEIVFISQIPWGIEQLKNTLDSLKLQKQSSTENIRSYLEDCENQNYFIELLERIFKEYFDKNFDSYIYPVLGKINFEQFKNKYFDDFSENEKIVECIKNSIVYKSESDYDDECQSEINKITKYIDFEYNHYKSSSHNTKYDVEISIGYFLKYILNKKIEKISNTDDIIEDYISYYQLYSFEDYIYIDLNIDEVKYDQDNYNIFNSVDAFFEKEFEEIERKEFTKEEEEERKKKINIYEDTLKKFFNSNMTYHNKNLSIVIYSLDNDSLLVNVKIHFNKSNKDYEGNISIDQLINYITHDDLFD
jgi:hypothetical protein